MPLLNFILSAFIEFGPGIGFFFAALYFNFYVGVIVLMILTPISLVLSKIRDKRIPTFMLISFLFVLCSGSLTLFFQEPYFTVLEYTIYCLGFSILCFVGHKKNKPILKSLFGTMFQISDKGWHIISNRWGIVFFVCAIISELVWHFFGMQSWLYFRLIQMFVLAFFALYQFKVIRKERLSSSSSWGLKVY